MNPWEDDGAGLNRSVWCGGDWLPEGICSWEIEEKGTRDGVPSLSAPLKILLPAPPSHSVITERGELVFLIQGKSLFHQSSLPSASSASLVFSAPLLPEVAPIPHLP